MKLKSFFIIFLSTFSFQLLFNESLDSTPVDLIYSSENQETLDAQNTSWNKVLPGKVLCAPQQTSYGFITVTDARNIIAFTSDGKTLFSKNIKRTPKPLLTVLPHDFTILATDNRTNIQLRNPSGIILWEKHFDSEIVCPPLAGKDGRFFVLTKDKFSCFGINGICKWENEMSIKKDDLQYVSLHEFPDGSVAVIFGKELIRFTPFGEEIFRFQFEQKIISSAEVKSGISVLLKNRTLNLFDGENIKWKMNDIDSISVSHDKKILAVLNSEKKSKNLFIKLPDLSDGTVTESYRLKNFNFAEKTKVKILNQGFFIYDDLKGTFFNKNGNCLWNASFPMQNNKSNWNYIFISDNNYLVFCENNWNMESYRILQNSYKQKKIREINTYENFYDYIDTDQFNNIFTQNLSETLTSPEYEKLLTEGYYGKKEQEIISGLYSATKAYYSLLNTSSFGTKKENSVFSKDSTGLSKILTLLSLIGTDTFNEHIALFLRNDTNVSNQIAILQGISKNGYDPDLLLLDSISYLSLKTSYKEKYLLTCICDAVYSICTYMGTPAFTSKGKAILSGFLYPSYSAETRAYARKTLTNLADFNQ